MNRFTHVDVHQHLWPEPLVAALRARRRAPRLRGWTLELAGEVQYAVQPEDHVPSLRAKQAARDGVDLALVSLSGPLGIESLPAAEAHELLDAYTEGVAVLGPPFGAWAAAALADPDPVALELQLGRGFVGLQLPASVLAEASGYDHVAPLLEVLEHRGRPLFIHPGAAADVSPRAPAWWPAMVPYVQQMHAAWFAFRAFGRPRHPKLRVCFAMLAGLAPLHGERFAARAGTRTEIDPDVFLDISCYGTKAIDAVIRVLGVDVLVNGSDGPYGAPVRAALGDAANHAMRQTNPSRLLGSKEVSRDFALAAGSQPRS